MFLGRALMSTAVKFYGPVQQSVETRLLSALNPSFLEVTNESHGKIENESHFHVLIVADDFEGKKLLAQHRLVNSVLAQENGELPFHSLRITSKTPAQWSADPAAPSAPQCKGGDGLKS